MTRIYKTTEPAAPAPSEHYRLSPSGSSRWLACPYSAQADLPQYTNDAAELGTEAHAWGANVLTKQATLDDVPEVFRDGVGMYVAHVLSNGCPTPIIERKWASPSIPEFGGTIDCLLITGQRAAVYDFKYGKWPVKAAGNTQLLCYASIIAEHFDIQEFYGVIVQPNAWNKETIQVAEFHNDQVEDHREKVAAAAVSDEKHTGDHCLWCPLLRSKQCREGLTHAHTVGWTNKYKHLGAKKR